MRDFYEKTIEPIDCSPEIMLNKWIVGPQLILKPLRAVLVMIMIVGITRVMMIVTIDSRVSQYAKCLTIV